MLYQYVEALDTEFVPITYHIELSTSIIISYAVYIRSLITVSLDYQPHGSDDSFRGMMKINWSSLRDNSNKLNRI
jgi:hypothetical protein